MKSVYEVELLRCYEVRQLFRSLAFKQKEKERDDDPVGFERSTFDEAMDVPGISVLTTLRDIVALLFDRGQLRERLNAIIYSL